ncbi:unnamed protein product [Notodromas monacha]|uniref:Sulfhydryl oxidase n=1 Tax=Notodromas monacha TaxID=399045 RepID=A0A7R9GBX7_9CRUS|nr:unnamed protein product [Notodromas monacha]CAG0915518.1 unnamed protein product [Notodromas monacha]
MAKQPNGFVKRAKLKSVQKPSAKKASFKKPRRVLPKDASKAHLKREVKSFVTKLNAGAEADFSDDDLAFDNVDPKKRNFEFDAAKPPIGKGKKKKFDFEAADDEQAADDAEEAAMWEAQSEILDPKFSKILFPPGAGKWFKNAPSYGSLTKWPDAPPKLVSEIEVEADEALANDARLYKRYLKVRPEKKDFHWVESVMKNGTVADKMAAFVVLIQDSPVQNFDRIVRFVNTTFNKQRREALMAVDTLREVFLSEILADSRRLRALKEQPLTELNKVVAANQKADSKNDESVTRLRIIAFWRFEDLVKKEYERFVNAVVALSADPVDATRLRTLHTLYSLLLNNPEQERKLLQTLVNKLGDPVKKVASSAAYRLTQLLINYPSLKAVVCEEVEHFVFRPNVGERSQYYAVCFLTQVILSHDEESLAVKLIIIYLSLFRKSITENVLGKKVVAGLLAGLRRAFPFAKSTLKTEAEAAKLEKLSAVKEESGHLKGAPRKERVPSPGSRLMAELNHLFRAVHDSSSFPVSVRALSVLEQVSESHSELTDRSLYRKLLDPQFGKSSAVTMFLTILFRVVSADRSKERQLAFLKRILQLCHTVSTELVCGLLVIISQILVKNPQFLATPFESVFLRPKTGEMNGRGGRGRDDDDDDDDEEEHFVDVDLIGDGDDGQKSEAVRASWVHTKPQQTSQDFDRHPDAPGSSSVAWEVARLCQHYHPTARLFAQQVASKRRVNYDGDPLKDFALLRFLDKFVAKNPKAAGQKKQTEWQPTERDVVFGKRSLHVPKDVYGTGMDAFLDKYVKLKDKETPRPQLDDKEREKRKRKREERKRRKAENEDAEELGSDVSDAEVDDFLAKELGLDEAESDEDLDFASGVGPSKKMRSRVDDDDDVGGSEADEMSSYGGMAALVKASLLPLLVAFAVAKPPGLGKAGAGDGLYKYSDKMQLLNNDSLEKYLLLSKTAWVIEFYSSWCGHCMNYAPTWKEFAQQIFEWRSVVRVGAIDCANDKNTPVCRAFQVMRYPTVRFFPPGMTSNKFLGVDVPSPAGIPNDKLRQKVADYVEEVRIKYNAKHFPDLVQLRDSQELPKPGKKMLVVVYEWEGDTDDIGREVALDASLFASDVDVVRAKATHPSYSKYKVMRTPAILFLDAEGSQVKILYGDQVSKMGFMDALKSLLPELNNDAPVVPGYNEVDFKPLQERVEENLVVVEEEEILANGKPRGAAYNTRVHMQDMTSAIRYSLSHEIALHSTISGEDYTNLRKFIAALAEFFPGPPPVTTKLGHLLAALDAVGGPGVITADQWLEMSKPVVAEIPVSGFVGCAGSSIKYRGYPCGLWTLFHAMTVEAVRVGQEARYGDVLDAVHGFVKSFFSCSYCSKHFQEMFAKTRQDVQDLESSVMWLWVSHNKLPKPGKKMLVVVYEWEGDTDDIGREVALDASLFASDVDVVRAKATHPSYSKYKVMRTPAILFLDAEGSQVKILYGDQVSKMGFMDALKSLLPELNNDAPVVPGYNEVDFKPLQERVEENLVVVEEEEILANGKPRGAAYNTRVHMQDMTSAIRYSLSHEIALHSTISGEDYTNLRKFIAALAEFFPGPPPVTTKLGHLLAALDAVGGPGVITADQWLEMSKPVVAEIPVSGFVGCAGSSIKYRGYPCGLWTLFHAMTVEAVRVGQEARYGDVLDAVHGFVKSFFSCSYCSKHFQEMFAKTRQDVQDLESSVMWLWVSHNKVNKRLAGDISEDPAAPKIQFPPPQLCPDCFDDSSAKWVKDRVYDFLLSYYGRENIVTSSSSVDNLTVLHGVSSSSAAALKPPSRILFTVLDVTICSLMYLLSAGVLVAVYYFLIVARRHKRVSADPLLPKWVQFK